MATAPGTSRCWLPGAHPPCRRSCSHGSSATPPWRVAPLRCRQGPHRPSPLIGSCPSPHLRYPAAYAGCCQALKQNLVSTAASRQPLRGAAVGRLSRGFTLLSSLSERRVSDLARRQRSAGPLDAMWEGRPSRAVARSFVQTTREEGCREGIAPPLRGVAPWTAEPTRATRGTLRGYKGPPPRASRASPMLGIPSSTGTTTRRSGARRRDSRLRAVNTRPCQRIVRDFRFEAVIGVRTAPPPRPQMQPGPSRSRSSPSPPPACCSPWACSLSPWAVCARRPALPLRLRGLRGCPRLTLLHEAPTAEHAGARQHPAGGRHGAARAAGLLPGVGGKTRAIDGVVGVVIAGGSHGASSSGRARGLARPPNRRRGPAAPIS